MCGWYKLTLAEAVHMGKSDHVINEKKWSVSNFHAAVSCGLNACFKSAEGRAAAEG